MCIRDRYRVVFDKSTVLNQDTNVLRLLVGYSDKGPFNIPTYIQSAADFIAMYGNINKTQERRGNFFHRTALQMLSVSPILCLNLKKFDTENVTGAQINTNFNAKDTIDTVQIPVCLLYTSFLKIFIEFFCIQCLKLVWIILIFNI